MEVSNRPYVLLNHAATIDGKLATSRGESKLSCEEDLRELHRLRASMDGVMVGINTVLRDDPRLSVRYGPGRTRRKIVVDTYARTPLEARLFQDGSEVIVICGREAPGDRLKALAGRSTVIQCNSHDGLVDLREALIRLRELGVESLLVEGGGTLSWGLLRARLVDELRLSIALVALGSEGTKNLFEGPSFAGISEAIRFKLLSLDRCVCGRMIFLRLGPEYG